MNKRFTKPDFSNNIINISATLAAFLGCPNDKPTLPVLEEQLQKGYKNIVFLILDGLGIHPIDQNLSDDSFLKKNIKQVLTSVFPSTTTNATTTFLTNQYPMEHGWFGWCLYFEELKKAVDIFLESDSFTGEPIEKGYVKKVLPIEPYYKKAKSEFTTSVVVPHYWNNDYDNRYNWTRLNDILMHIMNICENSGRQFIYAYCDQPDAIMHRFGVTSDQAKQLIGALDDAIEAMCKHLNDTLLVITADHGQIDIDERINLYADEELTALLEWPQYLEARAAAFKVKEGCREQFVQLFNRKYGTDFELFKTEDLIAENYFGGNLMGEHAKLLGDYIAIGFTNKILHLTPFTRPFKGHHTSLTEEMLVPLILVGDK